MRSISHGMRSCKCDRSEKCAKSSCPWSTAEPGFLIWVVSHLLRGLPALYLCEFPLHYRSAGSAVHRPSWYRDVTTAVPWVLVCNFMAHVIAWLGVPADSPTSNIARKKQRSSPMISLLKSTIEISNHNHITTTT